VLAKQFARIHRENLINFGAVPLTFANPADYDQLASGDTLAFRDLYAGLRANDVELENTTRHVRIRAHCALTDRQLEMVLAGGLIPVMRRRFAKESSARP